MRGESGGKSCLLGEETRQVLRCMFAATFLPDSPTNIMKRVMLLHDRDEGPASGAAGYVP
jgi:hypothetical protein